ncbi:MAG: hypothetical protein RIS86_465 [Planctomycetota bacterium]
MKSFYTLEEAAAKLGKTPAEVNAIADTGRLDRVMHEGQAKFKVEQVDLLAGFDSGGSIPLMEDSTIGLADSTAGTKPAGGLSLEDSVLGLADSGAGSSAPSLIDSSERTGISALSGKSGGGDALEIGLETVGSGSGLLDLTRESEETALGAELIDQVMSEDDAGGAAGGLFAPIGADSGFASPPVGTTGMAVAEAYDGAWSGVGVGLMVAAFVGLVAVAMIGTSVVFGAGSQVATMITGNLMAWAGSLAGIAAVFGLVGFFIGRASE